MIKISVKQGAQHVNSVVIYEPTPGLYLLNADLRAKRTDSDVQVESGTATIYFLNTDETLHAEDIATNSVITVTGLPPLYDSFVRINKYGCSVLFFKKDDYIDAIAQWHGNH